MSTFLQIYQETVLHIELDLNITGNLLFTDGRSLYTVTSEGRTNTTIMSSGTTNNAGPPIAGFAQLPDDQIVVVNNTGHCLLLLDRAKSLIPFLSGDCTEPGYKDGVGNKSILNAPLRIIRNVRALNHLCSLITGTMRCDL